MYLFIINTILFLFIPVYLSAQESLSSIADSIESHIDDELHQTWLDKADLFIRTHKVDSIDLFDFYRKLGYIYIKDRNYTHCREAYENALTKCPKGLRSSPTSQYCNIFNNLGIAYTLLNEKRKGIDYFTKSIHCTASLAGTRNTELAKDYRNLARTSFMAGFFQEAVDASNNALSLSDPITVKNARSYFDVYVLKARAFSHILHTDSSNHFLQKAENLLSIYPDQFMVRDEKFLYKAMLRHFRNSGDTLAVLEALKKFISSARSMSIEEQTLSSLINFHFTIALYQYYYLDALKAAEHIDTVMNLQFVMDNADKPILTSIKRPADIITHLQLQVLIYQKLWKTWHKTEYLRKALSSANLGMEVLELFRRILNDAESRLEYVQYEYDLFDSAMETYYQSWMNGLISLNDYWKISEKARAVHISEQSNLRSMESSYHQIDSQLIRLEDQLVDSIFRLSSALPERSSEIGISAISAKITDLKIQLYQLQDMIAKRHPKYQLKRIKRTTPPLADIQKRLRKGEMIVEYFYSPSLDAGQFDVYILFIAHDSVRLIKKNISQLDDKIQLYTKTISRAPFSYKDKNELLNSFAILDSMGWILRELLLPQDMVSGVSRLIIVPHKSLFSLPFSALPAQKHKMKYITDWKDYSFLGQLKEITMAFSADWWAKSFHNEHLSGKTLIASPGRSESQFQELKTLSAGSEEITFSKSRDALLDSLNNKHYNMLFIGAHAAYDKNEQNGLIYLANNETIDFRHILDLSLEGTKVILAACETQVGKESNSEGLMSFVYNFAWAGASGICGTLWRVPDHQTSLLIEHSIPELTDLSRMISSSKQAYLQKNTGIERHPYYWAAMVCFETYQPRRTKLRLLSVFGLGGLALLFVLWAKKIVTRYNG